MCAVKGTMDTHERTSWHGVWTMCPNDMSNNEQHFFVLICFENPAKSAGLARGHINNASLSLML